MTDLAQEIFQKTWSWFESVHGKRHIDDADRHNHKGSQTLKEAIRDLPESPICQCARSQKEAEYEAKRC